MLDGLAGPMLVFAPVFLDLGQPKGADTLCTGEFLAAVNHSFECHIGWVRFSLVN